MTTEEKTSMYQALGVHTFIEHTIDDHEKQWGKMPHKLILGDLEWKILGFDYQDDNYIKDVLLSLNQNVESGIVIVENK